MCGIAGVWHSEAERARQAVRAALTAQAHRGPDDEGLEVVPSGEGFLALGHRRLSILDLSPLGHQPMRHPQTESWIVFNGEIYNFARLRRELQKEGERFDSGSDTEVLLAGLVRYGTAYLERVEGMFAFAFLDGQRGECVVARDPAGIKPLYLSEVDGTLAFASEVRALLAMGLSSRRLDRRGVTTFLAYGAVQHPLTLFEGVTSLEPGTFRVYAPRPGGGVGCVRSGAFWRLPASGPVSAPQAVAQVRSTLDAAVHDHLVADVPVGIFLSSGLDSTLIAGLAVRHAPEVRSFTVVFADQEDFSEQRLAAETAELFGLRHQEIPLPQERAEAAVSDWLACLDQPSIDGLNVFVLSRAVRERGIKVALSGLGSDELFGGYPSFRDVPRLQQLRGWVGPLPGAIRRVLARLITMGRPSSVRAKLQDMLGGEGSLRSLALQRRRLMSQGQLRALGATTDELDEDCLPAGALADLDLSERDAVRVVSQIEFRAYQGNMLLRDADVNGMAHGLEIRVPFLDRRLLDWAHALPGDVRLPSGAAPKHLLRQAFADLLRPALLNQPKKGFTLPIRRWMVGSLRERCEKGLTALKDLRLLNPDAVTDLWEAFRREPDSPMWTRAFALVVLGEYLRQLREQPAG